MDEDRSAKSSYVAEIDLSELFEAQEQRKSAVKNELPQPRGKYCVELGGEPIPLELIEYRILTFLARKPYHAYTRRHIALAISTEANPVTETDIDNYILTLRDKLGLFSDYVQSVPYIGYRFKA